MFFGVVVKKNTLPHYHKKKCVEGMFHKKNIIYIAIYNCITPQVPQNFFVFDEGIFFDFYNPSYFQHIN